MTDANTNPPPDLGAPPPPPPPPPPGGPDQTTAAASVAVELTYKVSAVSHSADRDRVHFDITAIEDLAESFRSSWISFSWDYPAGGGPEEGAEAVVSISLPAATEAGS